MLAGFYFWKQLLQSRLARQLPRGGSQGGFRYSLASSSQQSKFRKPFASLAALLRCSLLLFPQIFCSAKSLWDNFRAPAKIAWRVLREEERQAYQVMRQTKRAADQNALPRRGGALTTCELGNAPLFGAFPDRGGVSLAPPRRWLAEGKTEGLLILPAIPLAPPVGGEQVHS